MRGNRKHECVRVNHSSCTGTTSPRSAADLFRNLADREIFVLVGREVGAPWMLVCLCNSPKGHVPLVAARRCRSCPAADIYSLINIDLCEAINIWHHMILASVRDCAETEATKLSIRRSVPRRIRSFGSSGLSGSHCADLLPSYTCRFVETQCIDFRCGRMLRNRREEERRATSATPFSYSLLPTCQYPLMSQDMRSRPMKLVGEYISDTAVKHRAILSCDGRTSFFHAEKY